MLEQVYTRMDEKMQACIAALRREYGGLRTGRASIALLEGIKVSYYGNPTPLNQIATLSAPDPHLLTIQPWDPSIIKEIERAILKSELGLTPNNDGKIIRLPIPALTEERRKQLVKLVKRLAEEAKVSLRNSRREAMDKLKQIEKNKEISEDVTHRAHDKIQEIIDNYSKQVSNIEQHKEAEVMEV